MIPLLGAGAHVLTIHDLDVVAVEERVRRNLAVEETQAAKHSPGVVSRLDVALRRARTLPVPRGAVATFGLQRDLAGNIQMPAFLKDDGSAAVTDRLAGASRVSAYVVTLGHEWDRVLMSLCDDDEAAEAWFLDQVANACIDEAARALEGMLAEAQARAARQRTRRIRAGYRGHPSLELQSLLCAATGAERLGVEVHESGALSPTKTVTGILGWRDVGGTHGFAS